MPAAADRRGAGERQAAPVSLQRQYTIAIGVLVLMVLGIIFLFGHLISRSLSRRYLEDALVSGRQEAQELAEEIAADPGGDLYEVVEKRRETLIRRNIELARKEVVERIEVFDREGNVVFRSDFRSEEQVPEELAGDVEVGGTLGDRNVFETDRSYEMRAPVGEIGEVVVGISKNRLAERVTRLRQELLQQTAVVAAVTVLTLLGAAGFLWHLIQRNRRLEEQRHAAEELATIGTLAANLAHEIRNPLNSINLNLELLEEDLGSGESLLSTRREVGRLARLVSEFLTYARPARPSAEPVMVVPLLREVVEFLRSEARAVGVHLRVDADAADVTVTADAGQLRQVLINLMLNGIQAVAELPPDRRVVEVSARPTDGELALVVRDRGAGIPAEEMGRVRQPFYTQRRGGSGLGLAIADRIAVAHGGRLELEDVDPFGLEARLVLPLPRGDGKMNA